MEKNNKIAPTMLFCPARTTGRGVAVVYRHLKEFGIKDAPILHALRISRLRKWSGGTSDLCWLTDAQMARLEPFFPKSHGEPRVDEEFVLIETFFIRHNDLLWCDAPPARIPRHKLYKR